MEIFEYEREEDVLSSECILTLLKIRVQTFLLQSNGDGIKDTTEGMEATSPSPRPFLVCLYASCSDYSIVLLMWYANAWGENILLLQNS